MKNRIKEILREGLIMEERIKFDLSVPDDIMVLNCILLVVLSFPKYLDIY